MLHEHTVLTTDHLARLGFSSLRTAQQRLQLLHRLGVLDRFQPYRPSGSAPLHHLLGPVGARILAAEEGLDVAALGYRRQRILAVAHRLSLGHDIGVATSIIDLATHPDLRLNRWWSAARCARLYGHHTRPDAYLTLTTEAPTGSPPVTSAGSAGWWEMFYEYDTGTEDLTTLAAKLAGYHRLAAATGIPTPVGFWITRPRREPHARQALAGAHQALPHPQLLIVLTGTPQPDLHALEPADRLATVRIDETAAGAVWLPLHPTPTPDTPAWAVGRSPNSPRQPGAVAVACPTPIRATPGTSARAAGSNSLPRIPTHHDQTPKSTSTAPRPPWRSACSTGDQAPHHQGLTRPGPSRRLGR